MVVHAVTEAPTGAKVTRPLTVVLCTAPDVAEPIVMVDVAPDAAPVPRLMVLVLPLAVTPAWMLVVWLSVD